MHSVAQEGSSIPTEIAELILKRRAIYEARRERCDPFAEPDENRWERLGFVVEAFDYLLADLEAACQKGRL